MVQVGSLQQVHPGARLHGVLSLGLAAETGRLGRELLGRLDRRELRGLRGGCGAIYL